MSKAHGYMLYLIVLKFLQIKAKRTEEGTTRSAERNHRPHRCPSRCRIHSLTQADQSYHQLTGTFTTSLSSPIVIPVTPWSWFVDGGTQYFARFLLDFLSLNRLVHSLGISPSYKVDWNKLLALESLVCLSWFQRENTRCRHSRCFDAGRRIVGSWFEVGSQCYPEHCCTLGRKKNLQHLWEALSTNSKFMSDFITDFRRTDKNLQCQSAMGPHGVYT